MCWPQAVHLEGETFITAKTTDVMVTSVVYYLRAIYQVYSLYIINLIAFILKGFTNCLGCVASNGRGNLE